MQLSRGVLHAALFKKRVQSDEKVQVHMHQSKLSRQ